MNQAATSYAPSSQAQGAGSAGNMLRELAAAMPIVILYKAVRTAFAKR